MINDVRTALDSILGNAAILSYANGKGRIFELFVMTEIAVRLQTQDSTYGFNAPMEPRSVRVMPIGGSLSAAALQPEFNRHRLVQTTPALSGSGEYPKAQVGRYGTPSSSKVEAEQPTKLISLSCRVRLEWNCGRPADRLSVDPE